MKTARGIHLLWICLTLFSCVEGLGQQASLPTGERCGLGIVMEKYFRQHPEYKSEFEKRQQAFQARYETMLRQKAAAPALLQRANAIMTIPVVVHIVLPDPSIVTDDQVQSEIDVLNADYAGLNADSTNIPPAFKGVFGKSQIRFCLAEHDPTGESSNGIVRVSSGTVSVAGQNDPVKSSSSGGSDAWNISKYLNIWVCDMQGGLLGYCFLPQTPGLPDAEVGVVNNYTAFGTIGTAQAPYDKGRTTTHEIGHYFNLIHIWGASGCDASCSDSDGVADTPNQNACTFGAPAFPLTDVCNTVAPGIMFMNYMDYSDDGVMCLFTQGQVDRMETALTTLPDRTPLLSSDGCTPAIVYNIDASAKSVSEPGKNVIICGNTIVPKVVIKNSGSTVLSSVKLNVSVDGQAPISTDLNINLAPFAEMTVSSNPVTSSGGSHTMKVYTSLPNGIADQNAANDTTNSVFSISDIKLTPITEDFETISFPANFWSNGNNSSNAAFNWKRVSNARHSGTASAKIDNYNLNVPGGYADLRTPQLQVPLGIDSMKMTFWLAAALYDNNTSDTLEVLISNDCGQTYSSAYKKWGQALNTHGNGLFVTSDYIPISSEWRQDTVDLTPFALGRSGNFIVTFRDINNYGNNIYIDDVNVRTRTLPARLKSSGYLISPNPFTSQFIIQNFPSAGNLKSIAIYNSVGQIVWYRTYSLGTADNYIPVYLGNVAAGIYNVHMIYKDKVVNDRIVKMN